MNSLRRLLAVCILVGFLIGVNFVYVTTEFRSYPSTDDILYEPSTINGQSVLVFQEAEAIDRETQQLTIVIEDMYFSGVGPWGFDLTPRAQREISVVLANTSVTGSIEAGSYLQIHGSMQEDSTVIDAQAIVVEYQHTGDWFYTYGISLVGALIAITAFFSQWQLTRTGFVPRRDR